MKKRTWDILMLCFISSILLWNISLRYADQLSIGDEVLVERNSELAPEKVINISIYHMQGRPYFKYLDFASQF